MAPEALVGSPFKKHRASLPGFDDGVRRSLGAAFVTGNDSAKPEGLRESPEAGNSAALGLGVNGGIAGDKVMDEEEL